MSKLTIRLFLLIIPFKPHVACVQYQPRAFCVCLFCFSDERPVADEPAGLTVAMRPYQLQTLQFMKDVEAAPGGYCSLFWLHCTGPRGEAYYYSTALHQLALTMPDMDTGGFLGQWAHQ